MFLDILFQIGKGMSVLRHTCIIGDDRTFGVSLNHLVKGDELIVNKYVYAALAFFLGGLGAHRFYRKQYGKALLYILFCWTGIPGVIGMIEGVIAFIKTADVQGNI